MTTDRIESIKFGGDFNHDELVRLCDLATWALTEQEKHRQAEIDTGILKPNIGTIATEAGGTGLK